MNTLLNTTIEIQEMSDKLGKFGPIKKIKGKNIETGQANTYTVYQTKQDGSISTAWTQLQTISVGDTVNVGYVEQSGVMQDGKPFTSRIVRNFDKDLGNGRKNYVQHNPPAPVQSPSQGQNIAPQRESSEAYGKRLAIHGMVNGLLASGMLFPDVIKSLPGLIQLEDEIEKALNPSPFRQAVQRTNPDFIKEHDLPTIQQDPTADEPTFSDDELADIPFWYENTHRITWQLDGYR